ECIVRSHVVHRTGELVVPSAPRLAAVGGDGGALVDHDEDDVGVVWVDPGFLVVIPVRAAAHGGPGHAAILGTPEHGGRGIDHVRVLAVDGKGRQVAATDARGRARIEHGIRRRGGVGRITRGEVPVRATVAGLVELHGPGRAFLRRRHLAGRARHHGIDDIRIARGDAEVGLDHAGRQAVGQFFPGAAAVRGLEDAAFGAAELLAFDVALLLLPQPGIDDVRVAGIDAHVVAADVLVLVQHFLEGLATVGRAEDAALLVRAVGMAKRGDEQAIRVVRVDRDVRDHLRVAQAQVGPGLAGVGGFVHAVAHGEIRADDAGARADVDHIRIRGRHRDRANRAGRLVIEQGHPVRAVVGGAPYAAIVEAGVEHVRLAGYAVQRPGTATAGGADGAPVHLGVVLRGLVAWRLGGGLRLGCRRQRHERDDSGDEAGNGEAEQAWGRHSEAPRGMGRGESGTMTLAWAPYPGYRGNDESGPLRSRHVLFEPGTLPAPRSTDQRLAFRLHTSRTRRGQAPTGAYGDAAANTLTPYASTCDIEPPTGYPWALQA